MSIRCQWRLMLSWRQIYKFLRMLDLVAKGARISAILPTLRTNIRTCKISRCQSRLMLTWRQIYEFLRILDLIAKAIWEVAGILHLLALTLIWILQDPGR